MSTHTAADGCGCMGYRDEELAHRAQLGDAAAYGELMRRHRRGAYRITYAILGSTDDAEDAVQEAFVKAYQAIRSYNARSPFVAWLRRIGVNCAINRLRQRERERRSGENPMPVANPHGGRSPSGQAEAAELAAQVRRAIEALPLKQRLAVSLFHLEEMSLRETAEAIGCSVGAVKAHLHRAREALAQRLSHHILEVQEP